MQKKIVIVLGLGVSGIAAAKLLLQQNKLVLGIEGNQALLTNNEEIRQLRSWGMFVQHDSAWIDWLQVEVLVVSPGVSPKHPIYQQARQHRIPIQGEIELALPMCKTKLLAITGTNGKTTVTLLTQHILCTCGIRAKAVGNIGLPLCSFVTSLEDTEVLVIELSSYQLETMHTPVFDAAVLLNISPDHLDRYASMEEYAEAKCHLQNLLKSDAPFFIQSKAAAEYAHLMKTCNYQTFGINAGEDVRMDQKQILFHEKVACILPIDYRIGGKHDCENILAAWALCKTFSITSEQFCRALVTFQKPPHRIEFVCEIDGVVYYDDSKGTNIDAVVQAIHVMQGPVILIAGGTDKGASYLAWTQCAEKLKKILVFGQAAMKIYEELHLNIFVEIVDSLSLAVARAASIATKGDCVLLSPGCSSFDMFRDYAHRGQEFQREVRELLAERKGS